MNLLDLFKHLKPYVRPYRWLVFLALALTLVGSLTAQVNAWVLRYAVDSVAALLNLYPEATDAAQSAAPGAVSNAAISTGPDVIAAGFEVLALITLILLGKEVINVIIQFGQKYYGEKLRIHISHDLAQSVIERVLTYRLAFFSVNANQPGKLQTRMDRGVESLTRLVQNFFIDILPMFASSVVALAMMFNANFYVGLVGFATVPIYYYVSRKQAARLSGSRHLIKELRENKSHGILSILESMPVIKSFLREDIEKAKQMSLQTGLTDVQLKIRRTSFIFDGLKTFIEQIGVVGIIILTTWLVLSGQMSIGAIMFHILLYSNVTAPIRRLHLIYDQMNDALIYAESFFELLDDGEEKKSRVESSGNYRPDRNREQGLIGSFSLRGVDFTYPDNASPTLHDINMEIRPGETTALVGLSGAGKSTLINLLDKFYQPNSGQIMLDGVDLEEYDTAFVRENIGLVLQKNHIFNGTVAENIRYGNPTATDEEIVEAAKKAFLNRQVSAMPQGYDTPAPLLSGGQQQKIAIARMFLKNPPIIFLDEPTASLDALATQQIKKSLDAIKKDRTVVVISHSISQIIDADRIYVMQNGRIAEGGTHEELYHAAGAYRDIFDAMARSLNIDKIAKTLE
ncbi:MAG: ABC transporter ATP-binding protein/permease [Deltaproteobacteria bacterium]|jgi:ABC-type multidrug transport system fused ATPase/permease subunit|nr:ABC transporter ATP-binding protein/permease [Deltaproteobacteria bacterium]